MVVRPQRRERPRCDCGKDLKPSDLAGGICTGCGTRIEATAGERLVKWHGEDA